MSTPNVDIKESFKYGKTFIDLFAGLGGFHLALKHLGYQCVFACEIDERLQTPYKGNFGIEPMGDIREVSIETDIPPHDVLCAGFPCQPFSKAGEQNGFTDPRSGDLFYYILKTLEHHKPAFFILENVANFARHNGGRTWEQAKSMLISLGYDVDIKKLSPHYFGIPQIRERVIIVGSRIGLEHFSWPDYSQDRTLSIRSILDRDPIDARKLSTQALKCLEVWQQFLNLFPANMELPSFPIWTMEFGATYPYEETTPYALGSENLRPYRGSHGASLDLQNKDDQLNALPSYARTKEMLFPKWKIAFIRQNREFYTEHKQWIDKWLHKILQFPPSLQKFEWNCKGEKRVIWDFIIQFRASGVRVKRPTTAPSLVAMTSTQVPIIGWEKRYMTPLECARLQSMDELDLLPTTTTSAYKALGNAVNVKIIELVARNLLFSELWDKRSVSINLVGEYGLSNSLVVNR